MTLTLSTVDGANPAQPRKDLAELASDQVSAYVSSLSTRARLDQFAVDYHFPIQYMPVEDDPAAVSISLGDAMDFLTRKDYADNWLSETHEQFCGLEWADWKELLTEVGFEIDPVSGPWRNAWLATNRFAPVAALSDADGPIDWPVTHVLLIARRPLNAA